MEVRVAHWDALWKEYTMPRWARLRMSLYGERQRAFANVFNQMSALKEDKKSQRLVVAYGAGRWKTQKGTTPAPTTSAYKECARRFVTIPVGEFRTLYTHHELGCLLQRVEVGMCMRSPEDKKIRTADGGANGKDGESSRIACIGEYNPQRHETYGVCEPIF